MTGDERKFSRTVICLMALLTGPCWSCLLLLFLEMVVSWSSRGFTDTAEAAAMRARPAKGAMRAARGLTTAVPDLSSSG